MEWSAFWCPARWSFFRGFLTQPPSWIRVRTALSSTKGGELYHIWYILCGGTRSPRPLIWIGRSYEDLLDCPDEVRRTFGFALGLAQTGGKYVDAKPLKGFGGAGVLEVVEDHRGDTFRCVYAVRFAGAVYVLHAFQKKSKAGIKTPKQEIELVRERLKSAEELYRQWTKNR